MGLTNNFLKIKMHINENSSQNNSVVLCGFFLIFALVKRLWSYVQHHLNLGIVLFFFFLNVKKIQIAGMFVDISLIPRLIECYLLFTVKLSTMKVDPYIIAVSCLILPQAVCFKKQKKRIVAVTKKYAVSTYLISNYYLMFHKYQI